MSYFNFINRPLVIYKRIQHQIEEVRRLEDLCMQTTSGVSDDRVQSSRENTQEKRHVLLADAKRELNALAVELNDVCNEIKQFLYDNLSFDEADILEWKYINAKSITEIGIIQNITYSGAATKISRAEKKAEKAYLSNFAKH